MKRLVVSISRSYCSNGEVIGKKLAEELGIPFYDKAIIEMAAERTGLSSDYIDGMESHHTNSFLFNLASTSHVVSSSYTHSSVLPQYDLPINYKAFSAQTSVIKELAARGSCVIIGRCSEYILRDDPDCVKVFIHADKDFRINQLAKELDIDPKAAEVKLNKIDRGRATFYKNFTNENWGNVYSHDICIDSSRLGIDGAVNVLKTYLNEFSKE